MQRDALNIIQPLSDHGLVKVRDARTPRVVDKDVWLAGRQYGGETRSMTTTHTLDVPMNHISEVEVPETLSDVRQLVAGVSVVNITVGTLTSPSISAPGLLPMYSGRFPPGIHSEISWNGRAVTPSRGTTFGCFKCFQITASLQKAWEFC